ncbi:hypothetical protein HMPREF0083_00087 [Aneurinibacillus aneurinilyticus ATCC 12856]|uniref:Uncharacterized protein n=1 Tax=Aneurinibacillus aneurinilyticus ATCC 12856 TaxID=649747 RepID=U1XA37_ANEAE|nr:hypothetical protein HMPREF0083_00087 [Aneurinibacillus aneurinilyticus ATCC 12856]
MHLLSSTLWIINRHGKITKKETVLFLFSKLVFHYLFKFLQYFTISFLYIR